MAVLAKDIKMAGSWIDHPGKVALIGSIIILVGQFGATIFPILLGPDLSDYNLICDPVYHEIKLNDTRTVALSADYVSKGAFYFAVPFFSQIHLSSLHPLHKYTRQVSLIVSSPPGINCLLSKPIIDADTSC